MDAENASVTNTNTSTSDGLLLRLEVWPTIKHSAVRYYDDLGRMILANFLWLLASIPLVTLPMATIGFCRYCEQMLTFKDPPVSTVMTEGFRRFSLRGFLCCILMLIVLFLTGLSFIFYLKVAQQYSPVFLGLGGLALLIAIFALMTAFYALPFIVHQDIGVKHALKRAALVAGARPFVTLSLVVVCALLFVAGFFMPVLIALFVPGLCLTIANVATLLALDELEE